MIVIRRASSPDARRRLILGLTVYVVITHLVVGVTQHDAWPITNYCLMHGRSNLEKGELYRQRFFGVDPSGREWEIDPSAWGAMSDWHLQLWFYAQIDKLSAQEKRDAFHWVYQMAEKHRQQVVTGHRTLLGPLTAPQWWMFEPAPGVPSQPFRGVRVYSDRWFPAGTLAGRAPERKLLGEWQEP